MKNLFKKRSSKQEEQPQTIKVRTVQPTVQLFDKPKLMTNVFDRI
jgi:hypothetical protein